MPTNDFLPFAVDVNAGVMSQADYAERAGLGVVPGLADPDFANKAWRQGSVMAAMLGRVIAGEGLNALDNGEVDALKNNFLDALAARVLLKMQAINSAGGLEYSANRDYTPGAIVVKSGIKYICLTANGPSSTVKDPAQDTTCTYWASVVSMAQVSSTGGAGKIPITTEDGLIPQNTAGIWNANLNTIKIANGLMWQYGRASTDASSSAAAYVTFYEAFITVPIVFASYRTSVQTNDPNLRVCYTSAPSTTGIYVVAISAQTANIKVSSASFDWFAIGRWR